MANCNTKPDQVFEKRQSGSTEECCSAEMSVKCSLFGRSLAKTRQPRVSVAVAPQGSQRVLLSLDKNISEIYMLM